MPLGDTSEQQAFISAYFGAVTAGIPASFSIALWVGPTDTGTEFAYPGYARQTITNDATTWTAGSDGSTSATVTFPDATAASTTDDADRWVIFNGTAITAWEFLDSPLSVDAAGSVEAITMTVYNANPDLLGIL